MTNIAPSKTQKSLKNLRKINKNRKITKSHFETIFAPKCPQNATPKRSKNEQKNITKKEPKKDEKKERKKLQNEEKT